MKSHPLVCNYFFNKLTLEDFNNINTDNIKCCSYKCGDLIIKQDTVGDFIFLISTGNVVIIKDIENSQVELAKRGANSFVGEMSLFDGELRSANVIAHTDVVGYKISTEQFNFLVNEFSQIKLNVIKIISDSIRDSGVKLGQSDLTYNKNISFKDRELLNLKNLLNETLQLKRDIDEQKSELELINRQLEIKNRELNTLSIQDSLTLLYSKIQFMDLLEKEFYRSNRYNLDFTLLILDIDDFNNVNMEYGYFTGDLLLKAFSKKLHSLFNTEDTIARICNNQFGIIIPHRNLSGSKSTYQRVLNYFSNNEFQINRNKISITISIGISDNNNSDQKYMETYNRAIENLKTAKKEGKNRFIA